MSTDTCASLLTRLIGFPTENPGGDELALCAWLGGELRGRGADEVEVVEVPRAVGRGAYVHARFGRPRLLLNAHVDTVPAQAGWRGDPFTAVDDGARITGLGAADTKGAIAAALCALERARPDGIALLFSGDEEKGGSCVRAFLASPRAAGIERALVCEPTSRAAGTRHRGVRCYQLDLGGPGGHSSAADTMVNPLALLARAAAAIDDLGRRHRGQGPADMPGLQLNIARLDGGVAFNVVPDRAQLILSVRPPPGFAVAALDAEVDAVAHALDPAIVVTRPIQHAPFATRDDQPFRALLGGHVGGFVPLQFWTEAAVLAEAGIDAVVVGPGDISQAHAAGETVTHADLAWATDLFAHVFETWR
ncbi:MAG TPA: M20/M25/M40 family metallo-hydrolase [Kofleriaceae bacterium]|nr:M20/M25/M40 family metallo-hydrolase [Kofleriaceae bacterium]